MPSGSTALRERLIFKDVSLQRSITAGVDPSATLLAAKDEHTYVIRRITIVVTTSAAQALVFRTSNVAPVILVNFEASKDEGHYQFEFGEKGYTIPENEGLNLASAAGVAGIIIVDAHIRPAEGRALLPSQL